MTGSRFKTANEPLFSDAPVRNPRRIIKTGGGLGIGDQVWSWGSVVAPSVDTLGTPWYPPGAITLTKFIISVNGRDNVSDYTVELQVNGSAVATLVLTAGSFDAAMDLSEAVTDFDYIQPNVWALPEGFAEDMSIIIRYG